MAKSASHSRVPSDRKAVLLNLSIPSQSPGARRAQRSILAALKSARYDSQSLFAVRISLDEALVNAIKHGNRQDPDKRVRVTARITPKQATITVEDQGPGFNRAHVPDPTAEENLEKCTGRGILLIEAYMNKVQWSRGGRRLTMVKLNEGGRRRPRPRESGRPTRPPAK